MLAQMMRYGNGAFYPNNATDGANYWVGHPMMWGWGKGSGFWVGSIFCLVSWIIVMVVLIALARLLWYKGDREKNGRQ